MLLVISLIVSTMAITAFASSAFNSKEIIESTATIDNNFADNRVIVILSQKASLEFIDYTIADFPEVDCKCVFGVTTSINAVAKEAIENINRAVINGEELKITANLDLSDFRNMICLELNNTGKENVIKAIKSLQKREDVYFACPDYEVTFETPSVSYAQDSITRSAYTQPQDIYNLLGISDVWALLESFEISYSATPRVAVIDSGITHNSLNNRVVDTISADLSAFDDEYNSSIGIPENMMGKPRDDRGHGTMVAGIIASVVEPDFGQIDNMYYNISFSSIKVGGSEEETTNIMSVIAAINYVNDLQIPIINISNISVIPPTKADLSILYQNAISGYQGLIVCAAGNSGEYLETEYEDDDAADNDLLPAALIADNLITVGACDLNGSRLSISNWGNKNVELFAPGKSILSCFPEWMCGTNVCENGDGYENSHAIIDVDNDGQADDGYHYLTGTSFAAPWVTGVAAMILALVPNLSNDMEQVKNIITSTVDKYDSLEDKCITGGRLNVYDAIMKATNYCQHNAFEYINRGSTGHNVRCGLCHHISYEDHNLYIYSQNSSVCVVKCDSCTYSVTCYDELEFDGSTIQGHYVNCLTSSCFSLFEPHTFRYTQTDSLSIHSSYCMVCEATYTEYHDWVTIIGGYQCSICLKTSTIVPGEVQNLTDEELAALLSSLTDEELAELTLALNEQERGRVAALLPEREDDLVTE